MRKPKRPIRRKYYAEIGGTFDEYTGGTFDEEAIAYVMELREQFAAMEDGHHAQIRQFLQDVYAAALSFREQPEAFEQLKADPFWESSRQKPKDASTTKWLLYFIMRATTPNVRNRAGKYAVVLDGLSEDAVASQEVAQRIAQLGGVEAAYEFFGSGKRRAAPSPDTEDGEEDALREPDHAQSADAADADVGQAPKTEKVGTAAVRASATRRSGRHAPQQHDIDLDRSLIVELEQEELHRILAAATRGGKAARFLLKVTVYPRDGRNWVRVVGNEVKSIVAASEIA